MACPAGSETTVSERSQISDITPRNPIEYIRFHMLRLILTIGLAMTSIAGAAQLAPPSVIGSQKTVTPAGEEASVDLVVRDKHGRLIRDLHPGEIRLSDEGVRTRVTRLSLVSGSEGHQAAFVFDGLDAVSGKLARDTALQVLGSMAAGVNISVWKIHDHLTLLQPPGADREAAKRAIEHATAADAHGASTPDSTATSDPASPLAQVSSASERMIRDEHFHPCISRLLALAQRLGTLPGRKSILYFSDGVDVMAASPEHLWSLIGTANQARVSIYALDVSGLTKAARIAAYGAPAPAAEVDADVGMMGNALVPKATAKAVAEAPMPADNRPPLRKLAESTGGIYLDETNDPHAHIEWVAEDLGVHYEATYLRPASESDGRFRPVSVRVARKDAMVQARAGYFALPPKSGMDLRPFEVPLLEALDGAGRAETFPLRGRVFRFGPVGDKTEAELVVQIPLAAFACVDLKDAPSCRSHFSILALVKDASGRIAAKFSLDRPSQMTHARLAEARKDVFTFQRPFEIAGGEYHVDIAVFDRAGGSMSTKTVAFSVPRAAAGVSVSDVAVLRRLEPLTASTELEPLQYQRRLLIPDLALSWAQEDRQVPVFLTVYPDAHNSEKPKLTLELVRGDQTLATLPATLSEARPGAPIPFVTAIRAGLLGPGNWQLKARVTQGNGTVEQDAAFEVQQAAAGVPPSETAALDRNAVFESGPELMRTLLKPNDAEMKRIIDAARQHALAYKDDLTNFACIEVTRRTVDKAGSGDWKPKDTITEVLQYIDGAESAQLLEVNGNKDPGQIDTTAGRVFGEFASLFDLVFSERAAADIEWEDITDWKGARVNVFRFRVPASRSSYRLTARNGGKTMLAGYKGLVYIDGNSNIVRRISLEATGIPKEFPIYRSDIAVDYDWVQISGREYLLPQLTTLYIGTGRHSLVKTEKEFRDYRRYEVGADWKGNAAAASGGSETP